MIFHSIISLSFAEGTERILRYTSLLYLHRTCITIMSCWCNVCRGLNIETMLSSNSWRRACLISLRFSAYLIRFSYQGVKKLPFFFTLLSCFLIPSCNILTWQRWVFPCIIENTNPSETNNSCKIISPTQISGSWAVLSLLSFPTFYLVNVVPLSADSGIPQPKSV